jgi:heptosyltransferase-2
LKIFGIENDHEGLDYFLAKEEEVDLKTLPSVFQQGYIGWVIGAKHNTKKFPIDKIVRILLQVDYPVILLGGREDEERAEEIRSSLGDSALIVFNACGKFSLNQSASLVQQSELIISNDTGLMHIASAFKKPIISLWGNTIPEFGMSPYYGKSKMLGSLFEIRNLKCRPCSKLGHRSCPLGHFKCMNLLDEKRIIEEVQRRIAVELKKHNF